MVSPNWYALIAVAVMASTGGFLFAPAATGRILYWWQESNPERARQYGPPFSIVGIITGLWMFRATSLGQFAAPELIQAVLSLWAGALITIPYDEYPTFERFRPTTARGRRVMVGLGLICLVAASGWALLGGGPNLTAAT